MYKEAINFHKYVGVPVIILMAIIWLLTGCGVEKEYYHTHTDTEREVIVTPETLQGVYQFQEVSSGKLSGILALTLDYQNKIDVEQLETFRSQNFNGTYGTHPKINLANLTVLNKRMNHSADVTYTGNNDLEKDGTTNDLGAGKRYTVYTLYVNEDNVLTLKIEIHEDATTGSGGPNNLVITRIFEAVK